MKKIILLFVFLASGCMTYRNIPIVSEDSSPAKRPASLSYHIEGSALFAGPTAVRDALTAHAPYAELLPADAPVVKGDYLSVKIEQTPPSAAASVFGYISYATLTAIPFWSLNDGSILTFSLYRNGAVVASKEYVISRSTFVWLPMVVVSWVNALTPSESEAFSASTQDFLRSIK